MGIEVREECSSIHSDVALICFFLQGAGGRGGYQGFQQGGNRGQPPRQGNQGFQQNRQPYRSDVSTPSLIVMYAFRDTLFLGASRDR